MTTPPVVSPTQGPKRAVVLAVAAFIVGCIAVVWMHSCWDNPPNIPPATQKSIDSLAIMKPTFDSAQQAGRQQVARDTTAAVTHQAVAQKTTIVSRSAGIVADSLAIVARRLTNRPESAALLDSINSAKAAARASDSAATAWHAAYDARTIEAQQWRLAAAQSDSAYQAERDATRGAMLLYAADTARRVASEKVNAELVTAIGKLQQPCRIIGPIRCPSRTVSAIAGVGATVGAILVARSLTAKP